MKRAWRRAEVVSNTISCTLLVERQTHILHRVPLRDVGDFVSENGGQEGIIVNQVDQSCVNKDVL